MTRSALFFPLVLAVMLALLTFWINQTVEEQGPKIDGSNRHDPDYTMHNFVTTQTDATGRLSYILAATQMLHYPDDDSTVLQRPRFTQYTLDKPYTQIEGLHGYISSNGEQVTLVNNVKVVRQAFEGKGEMQILTEKLLIFPKKDFAKTDAPVRITQAPKTVITGVGMVYDKKAQTVTLLNRVKVHYERPPVTAQKSAPVAKKSKASAISKRKVNNQKTNSNKLKAPVKPARQSGAKQSSAKQAGLSAGKTSKIATKKPTTVNSQVKNRSTQMQKKKQQLNTKSRRNNA